MIGYKVDISNLYKEYKKIVVINNLSLIIKPGTITGVCGSNGAGKTTLLRIIALVDSEYKGSVFINDFDVEKSGKLLRNDIGYVPQEHAMYEELSVKDNLKLFSLNDKQKTDEKIAELSAALDMKEFLKKKINTLSGGMKKRVNLAMTLMNEPKLLVADEPFAGLDSIQREKVIIYLSKLAKKGVTQIISSHVDESIEKLADNIIYMEEHSKQ